MQSEVRPETLTYDDRGLLPVVVQEVATGTVLMLAWADREAVERTLATGQGWFWSRSRQELWHKGATSGNTLTVVDVLADCDRDSLLYRAHANGPTCHRETRSCFEPSTGEIELGWLWRVLGERRAAGDTSSYTARLLADGTPRIAQKLAEEAAETVIAALARGAGSNAVGSSWHDPRDAGGLIDESADLLYHWLVLLLDAGVSPRQVAERLVERHRPSDASGDNP